MLTGEENKEVRRKRVTLTKTFCSFEVTAKFTIDRDREPGCGDALGNQLPEMSWETKSFKGILNKIPIYRVKCFLQIYFQHATF